MNVWVNGLSAGGGGGYAVATEMTRWLGVVRPGWQVTLLLRNGNILHEEARGEIFPQNVQLLFVERSLQSIWERRRYETKLLPELLKGEDADCLINLNGMIMGNPGIPTICHFQDPWAYRREAWQGLADRALAMVKRSQHRRSIARADLCTWTSHYLEDLTIGSIGTKPLRSTVVYNGIPDHWVDRQDPIPLSKRPRTIATISNVAHYKRQWLVVDAMAKLASEGRLDFDYHIVGHLTDAYRWELQNRIDHHRLQDCIVIEGRVPATRLQEVLASARVMPMMSICESFGIPCIEAMSLGTPVIISDCCALPEVCGDAAKHVPVDDSNALANSLFELVHDPTLWQQLSDAGLQRVKRFRWRISMELLATEIETMLHHNSVSAVGTKVDRANALASVASGTENR